MKEVIPGKKWRGKTIKEVIPLSNGWILIKTENSKSENDFKVKVIFPETGRSMTPKHAHFLIDFYGKLCNDYQKTEKLFQSIIRVWSGEDVREVLEDLRNLQLPGYPAEYILYAMKWILEQEDINFTRRPEEKQEEINRVFKELRNIGLNINVPENRIGSQLAIAMFGEVFLGTHPVEALIRAGLDIRPIK